MSDTIIKVENLSKQYRIGAREGYKTFRETLVDATKAPFQQLERLINPKSKNQYPKFENIWALKDISFDVNQGEVLGIIGRNGAGKSTLLKILSKITDPTEGRVELKGRVGSLLEVGTGFHPELTGHENVYLYGAILGMDRWEVTRKFDEIIAFAELEKFVDTPVKRYSSGMYMRLAFAVAAHLEPEILLVDEVLAVGDAAFQKKCLGKMGDVSKQGRTVLFVSHNMAAIRALCRKTILLEKGLISKVGSASNVVDAYMHEVIDEAIGTTSHHFPIHNEEYELSINNCCVDVEQAESGRRLLRVELEMEAKRSLNHIGVGFSLTSTDGTMVSMLGPALTNFIIEKLFGNTRCVILCRDIDSYLSGGDYVLGIWLAKTNIEYIIRLDEAAKIVIPPRDIFRSGCYVEKESHGIVPLPIEFTVL